jgi:glycosyltransferase involved in cell wall biosynthesis
MRIAVVTCVYPPYRGGIGHAAERQAALLTEMGHTVDVYCPALGPSGRPPEGNGGANVHRLRPLLRYSNSALLPQLTGIARHSDAVWIHYPFYGGAEWAALGAALWRRPYVLTFHMDVLADGVKGAVLRGYDRIIAPRILRGARAVAVSSHDYARHSSLRRLRLTNVVELPYGIDTRRYSPGEPDRATLVRLGLRHDVPVIAFVGGMDMPHAFKGVPVLLQAFADRGLGRRAQLVLVGDGELRPSFERQAASLGLGDAVRFLGRTEEADMIQVYRSAAATVLPSTTGEEAFGIVLIEAMACGSPVIASGLPGVRTVVGEGDEARGLLVTPGDASSLAEALERILHDDALRDTYRSRALSAVATRFSREGESKGLAVILGRLQAGV